MTVWASATSAVSGWSDGTPVANSSVEAEKRVPPECGARWMYSPAATKGWPETQRHRAFRLQPKVYLLRYGSGRGLWINLWTVRVPHRPDTKRRPPGRTPEGLRLAAPMLSATTSKHPTTTYGAVSTPRHRIGEMYLQLPVDA